MDFCSLDDAFPAAGTTGKGVSSPSIGCAGGEATTTALKHEKKRAKKCKGPRLQFVESNLDEAAAGGMAPPPDSDPDRPSMGYRTAAPAPFTAGVGTGPSAGAAAEGYQSHEGFTSCGAKKPSEKFQGGIQPMINNVEKATGSAPDWFTQQVTSEDGFTPYTGSGSDDENANSAEYLLQPSFENSFSALGVDKANGGPVLPLPNLSDRWKPMTPGGTTAFYERLPATDGGAAGGADVAEIKTKLDRIFARLDELDTRRVCTDNSNTEVGMFVMSGVFVMFLMDLLVRKTSTNLRIFSA